MYHTVLNILYVALGSAAGGVSRYLTTQTASRLWPGAALPLGTLCVNVLGCTLIGFLNAVCFRGQSLSPECRLVFITGFCGAYTTFSTFVNDDVKLLRDGLWSVSFLYFVLSLLLGFAALYAGGRLGRLV